MGQKSRWPLPNNVHPPRYKTYTICVPDEQFYISAFEGLLIELTYSKNWQRDSAHTAAEVTRVWQEVLASSPCTADNGNGCASCAGIGDDMGLIRQNGCLLETSMDGVTWCTLADFSACVAGQGAQSKAGTLPGPGEQYTTCQTLQGNQQRLIPVPLSTGDTIQFKAGVRYKGQLIINSSGTAGNPITYKGTGWGTGKAIMDGSVLHSNAWTQCTSSGQVYGNANYASIWFSTTTFTNQTSLNTVIQSNTALPFAQITTPERPVWFDVVTNWNTEAIGNVGQSSFTDTSLFTQTDVDFWRGAHLAIHKSPNSVSIKLIAGLDPTTDTITNAAHSNTSFYDPTPFEILGHPLHISYPGEYAVITNRMWYWPTNASDPNNLQIYVAQQTNAIAISGESYITIDGFEFTGYFGPIELVRL